MSTKFPGGLITKTPVTPAGPYETGAAPGVWTVEQALQYTKQGIWPTAGNVPAYIEDVFSTYLYTGNGSTQTITNGIDLSTKGGLVWSKDRTGTNRHRLYDTVRGGNKSLATDGTEAQDTWTAPYIMTFNSNGYETGLLNNESGPNYASWTFRKQPKFFDVVTYTGNGSTQTINHNLGSVPGCIIVKNVSNTSNWPVYHRGYSSLGGSGDIIQILNNTNAAFFSTAFNNTLPTSTNFQVGLASGTNNTNVNGDTYVAYLFAHNAGGFGLTGTDNVISCGSYTGSGSVDTVTLGYEPQWILMKGTNAPGLPWLMFDNMRGLSYTNNAQLDPSTSAAESSTSAYVRPTATGFTVQPGFYGTGASVIYIAIRRGPMKVPTSGTNVFSPVAQTKSSFPSTVTAGFPVDLTIEANRASDGLNSTAIDRLRGGSVASITSGTAAEYGSAGCSFASNTVFSDGWLNNTSNIYWMFRRAPSFFDEVCYTGTGTATTVAHNLGVVPELMIVKSRSAAGNQWAVYAAPSGNTNVIYLNKTDATSSNQYVWNNTTPTSTVFTVSIAGAVNTSAATYVAYLFATCAGVSKVGSYTGNGSTQTINCGFTGGARFVLIKRTDSTGDWYVWDTARGMVAGTDPNLQLNTTNAETNTNSIYTTTGGFQIVSTAAGINASGGTYIYLAIA